MVEPATPAVVRGMERLLNKNRAVGTEQLSSMSGRNLRSKGKLGGDNAAGHRSAEGKADSAGAAPVPVSKATFPHIRQVPALLRAQGGERAQQTGRARKRRRRRQQQQQQQRHATSGSNTACV